MNSRNALGQFTCNKNEWVLRDDVAECYLNGELLFFTDLDLYETLRDKSFAKLADGYSSTRIDNIETPVHRLISNPKPTELVDHINRNKKDNRRANLRNTDKSENAYNSKLRSTNTSGIRGVWYRKDTNKWVAEIKKNRKKICIGCFNTKDEAANARREKEISLYGY